LRPRLSLAQSKITVWFSAKNGDAAFATMAGRGTKLAAADRRQQFVKERLDTSSKNSDANFFWCRPLRKSILGFWRRPPDEGRMLGDILIPFSGAAEGHKAFLLRSFFPHFNKANSKGEL
jgi:hypothetical protein